ncbi:hypothetical protein RO3G_04737 [Lichtheimia corymbifera JMRC:FSU:9682]|uniref:BHLH domain-containing protein n=1 Tax=Lichtheimia corymbifera JMRC:FSU:9682 TaxID=1263082 RepID=A0A068RUC3_9FUNG|nr:hypothetical protein RO3G_04737 [Lichtheimia corymbifera JMRC:FSU:9682]
MSEIVLSNTTTCSNQYIPAEYSNPDPIMSTGAFDSMVEQQKMDSPSATAAFDDGTQQQQQQQQQQQPFYQGYGFQQMQMHYQAMPTMAAAAAYQMRLNGYHPTSPDDSISSNSSPQTPPAAAAAGNNNNSNMGITAATTTTTAPTTTPAVMDNSVSTCSTAAAAAAAAAINFSQLSVQPLDTPIPPQPPTATPLISSSSSTTTFSNSTTERVKETIARANSVPMEFYHTEFLEYSKETYERKMDAKRNKRKRSAGIHSNNSSSEDLVSKKKRDEAADSEEDDVDDDDLDERNHGGATSAELRRQIHIQSEQKRRAQIKDGFDELRKHLPGCNNKKMSKAALLTRTVQQIQHLKNMQSELLAEVERLVQENDNLKKFQHNVLQRQAMEKMYTF